ncbi:MAG: FHA domain-containing protein, partial [Planctomycetaceae bacterium]
DRFRRECGQKTAYIVRTSSSQPGNGSQPLLWDRPTLIVGRGGDCDLCLPHSEISRQHAYFQIIGDRIYCADLGSRTGTHWSNGATQAGWIDPNEPVSLGPYSLTFEPVPLPVDPEADSPDDATSDLTESELDEEAGPGNGHDLFLHFLNAGRKVRCYRVTRDVTLIGSSDGVKIHLSHPSVSNVHCSVVRTAAGLWLVDLLSADGTIVNGHIEPLASLRSGDEFQVGRFLVAVHHGENEGGGEPASAAPAGHRQSSLSPSEPTTDSTTGASPRVDRNGAKPGRLSALNQLAYLTASLSPANGVPAPLEGLSEQFVLSIIKELGVMQQQALQHAQEAMRETVNQLSLNYQQRIDTLERQHATLRDRLYEMTAGRAAGRLSGPHSPEPDVDAETGLNGVPNGSLDRDERFAVFAGPSPDAAPDVFDELDPGDREQWIRNQIKTVEAELDKTRRGWGKRLVDLLGY